MGNPQDWPRIPGTSPDGQHLTVTILVGPEAWEDAKGWAHPGEAPPPPFVVMPPGEYPASFDWSLLSWHLPVIVRPCPAITQPETAALVGALVRDGVGRVLVVGRTAIRLYRGSSQ